ATKQLMLALAAAGDRAGAMKQARLYQELVRQDLEIEPDAEIESIAKALGRHAITEIPENRALGKTTAQDESRSADHVPNRVDTSSSAASVAAARVKGKQGGRRDRALLYAVIPVAILMTGAAIWGWMRPAPSQRVVQYTMGLDSNEAIVPSTPWSGRIDISPDGSLLAYIGGPRSQLLIQPRSQPHAIVVPGTEGAASPFFSPDGKHVGFLREGIVQIASVSGGPPSNVSDSLTGVAGASWATGGFILSAG